MEICPVCCSPARPTSIRLTTTRPFVIQQCGTCALAFATPRPTEEELRDFYTGAYFDGTNAVGGYGDYEGESWAEPNARRMWSLLNDWDATLALVPRRSLLDVGCATGEFAATMKAEGWDVAGVELAEEARHKAEAKGVRTARHLTDLDASFGLITMFHVLEHVIEPVETLAQARAHAEPDGLLLVEVPQWNSVGRYVKRSRWSSLTPPEHINFFSTPAIEEALSRSGWRLVRADTCHTQGLDRCVEALRRRRYVRALTQLLTTSALELTGRAGYLRVLAQPT